jgi:AbrB family looped-hinge helix DNA binding protein
LSKIRENGLIVIPKNVRDLLDISTGDDYYVKANNTTDEHSGWLMIEVYWNQKHT